MEDKVKYLYTQDSSVMQLSYTEYLSLQEKMKEATKIQELKEKILVRLQRMLNGNTAADPEALSEAECMPVRIESETETPNSDMSAADRPEATVAPVKKTAEGARADISNVPPIKSEISDHFNRYDESGRLFNIFKQYYTCLNEACGGTVRVTMKDGICSLWNYDEWEEFAYVDIHEEMLRIAFNPRCTNSKKSLNLCESSRLVANRRNVISVQVGDLNQTVLEILTQAFSEVSMQVG
jgi:hypothetical protein